MRHLVVALVKAWVYVINNALVKRNAVRLKRLAVAALTFCGGGDAFCDIDEVDPFAVGFDQMIDHLAGAVNIIVDYVIARFVFAFSEQKQIRDAKGIEKTFVFFSCQHGGCKHKAVNPVAHKRTHRFFFLLYVGMRVGEDNAIALFRRHFFDALDHRREQ